MRRALVACLVVAACRSNGVEGGLDFQRMVVQPKGDAYEASRLFPDGKVMRAPPMHTVPHEDGTADAVVRTGRRDGTWVARSPLGYPMTLLERGRDRFDVYCTPCHGYDGLAATPVAAAMELKPPPPLLAPFIEALPDGRIFEIVRDGYGLMPGYGDQLPVHDRWAVVGYVRALQLRQRVPLDSLGPAVRDSLVRAMGRAGLDARGGAP